MIDIWIGAAFAGGIAASAVVFFFIRHFQSENRESFEDISIDLSKLWPKISLADSKQTRVITRRMAILFLLNTKTPITEKRIAATIVKLTSEYPSGA